MTKLFTALFALTWLFAASLPAQNLVANFDNITFWTGTGSNRAALVLDFDAGGGNRISVAWGYRWDGPAVMEDMLFALAGSITGSSLAPSPQSGSDARLAADVGYFEGYGFFVNSLTFDARGLGGFWPNSRLRIKDDFFGTGTYPAVYFRPGDGTWTPQPFDFSTNDGIPTLALQNGGWFGVVQSEGEETFSFATPFAAPANTPEPIPVPSTLVHRSGTGATVTFTSAAGYYYQLQANTNLAETGWTDVGTAMAGHGQLLTLSDPDAASFTQRFYRVVIFR
jgi:hypothetical protein